MPSTSRYAQEARPYAIALLLAVATTILLLRAIDPVRWPLAIPLAVLAPLGVWWVLKRMLLIQLPAGVFEFG